jgi:RNA polymerase sigma-70 factor, ECF subfamily
VLYFLSWLPGPSAKAGHRSLPLEKGPCHKDLGCPKTDRRQSAIRVTIRSKTVSKSWKGREEPKAELTDSELIQRVLAGDETAERALYDAHVDRVYRLAYRLAGNDPDLAQDFTQETFVRAFSRLREFQGRSAFSTWLHSIAVSVSLNGLRKVKRHRTHEVDIDAVAPVAFVGPRNAEPDLKERLKNAIADLPEHYRAVFVMYDMEGYSHEEIGSALNVPVGTSKARLSRAREKLREQLADFAEEWAQ